MSPAQLVHCYYAFAISSTTGIDDILHQGLTGMRIGRLLEALSTTVIAVFLSFFYEWRLAAFLLLTFPLLALGAFLELEILSSTSFVENSVAQIEEEKASEVAAEALGESMAKRISKKL